MKIWHIGAAVVLSCATWGCSEREQPLDPGEEGPSLSFETGEYTVGAGDQFTCFYTDFVTDKELAVYGTEGVQSAGGHHVLVYYTDAPQEPQKVDCADVDMTNLRQVAAAGDDGTQVLNLDDGMALRVPAGKQLVVESHYINTTGEDFKANDQIKLLLRDPAEVTDYVGSFVTLDVQFEVPPQATNTSTTECVVPRDLDLVVTLGHMHEWGDRYRLDVIDDDGQVLETLRDDEWTELYVSHPPISKYSRDAPLHLAKGTRLRQQCSWSNNTSEPLVFPREMCLAFTYYYPDDGDIFCVMTPMADP